MNTTKSYYSGADLLLGVLLIMLCIGLFHLAEINIYHGVARERFSLFFDIPLAIFLFLQAVRLSYTEKGGIGIMRRKRLLFYQGLILGAIGLLQCFVFESSLFLLLGIVHLFLALIMTISTYLVSILFLAALFTAHYLQFTEKPWLVQGSSSPALNILGLVTLRGYYSIFPWICFSLVGLIFGRIKLSFMSVIGIPLAIALVLLALFTESQLKDMFTLAANPNLFQQGLEGPNFFLPSFFLVGLAFGMAIWYFSIKLNSNKKWNPFGIIGYMKYSILIFAGIYQVVIALFLPQDISQQAMIVMQLAFWLVVLPFSYFWRKHFKLGPVEQVFKRLY
ncbi:MAG: hypothetical protein P8N19_02725 [Flavobacteriales bacterium]|nr:hypothetical protein [Flavobacteriales bacterium]MDG1765329.1 hypothetical protein [Flavobacteriales bacterium]